MKNDSFFGFQITDEDVYNVIWNHFPEYVNTISLDDCEHILQKRIDKNFVMKAVAKVDSDDIDYLTEIAQAEIRRQIENDPEILSLEVPKSKFR